MGEMVSTDVSTIPAQLNRGQIPEREHELYLAHSYEGRKNKFSKYHLTRQRCIGGLRLGAEVRYKVQPSCLPYCKAALQWWPQTWC